MKLREGSFRCTALEIAIIGLMVAILEVGKVALEGIPNCEVVTLFVILFTIFLGRKILYVTVAFVGLECLRHGISIWVIMYLYIWPVIGLVALPFRKIKNPLFWAFYSGLTGLGFGTACSLVYPVFLGWSFRQTGVWIAAGFPFDIYHAVYNFILALLLFYPLNTALTRIKRMLTEDDGLR